MNGSSDYKYIPEFLPEKTATAEGNAWAIILSAKKLLMKKSESKFDIPEIKEIKDIVIEVRSMVYIGRYDSHECFCIRLLEEPELPENLQWIELSQLTNLSGDTGLFLLAGAANHILHWSSVNQYCGCCGNRMEEKKDERAKICPNCGNVVYPRISPATITAVFYDDQILLAHNRNFREGLYSLIAGFVEPGESLEQCVAREIYEEVGVKVKNIRYFGSQPWSFPDSLMLAFTAEYESGEIAVDNCEIMDARWYHANSLPEIPSTDSISGKIIRWYRDNYAK